MSLPPEGTSTVLAMTFAGGEGDEALVRFRGGMVGSGTPVPNAVLVAGRTGEFACLQPGIVRFRAKPFLRGDCNDDGSVDISDAVCILGWLFLGGDTPGCPAVTNTNGDAGADVSDPTYLLNHLFRGGPPPVAPYPGCGVGTSAADRRMGCGTPPESCRR